MSKSKIEKRKRQLIRLEKQRKKSLEVLMSDKALIQGGFTELLVRCGKSGCHCEKKPAHLVTRLGVREDGKIKNKLVRVEDRDWVLRLVKTYKEHKSAMRYVQKIDALEKDVMKALIELKNKRYE
jgi:Family of unknown function (DUF6788)